MKSLASIIAAAALLTSGACFAQNTQANSASGNNNQAVVTTSANAAAPAKGASSFTAGQAQSRIERNGYANVTNLRKDNNGVWRGMAQKNGAPTAVWLDYKGNVGQAAQ